MKEKKNINYYKISTIALLLLILIVSGFFGIKTYGNSQYKQGLQDGQQLVFNGIATNVNKNNFVSFGKNNDTLTLVPAKLLEKQQNDIILQIMDSINKEGAVKLLYNNTEVILAPVKSQE